MAIYKFNSDDLFGAYAVDGDALDYAYNKTGDVIFSREPVLKVMTYNVQYFNGINAQKVMQEAIINTYNVDVIGLQEIGTGSMPTLGTEVLNRYPNQYLGVQHNKTALASKRQMTDVSAELFSVGEFETRGYNKAYIDVSGKSVCIINTHVALNTNPRRSEFAELLEVAEAEDYVVIMGDMNTNGLSVQSDDYVYCYKPFVDAGYKLANCSPSAGFTKTWTDLTSATDLSQFSKATDTIIVSSNIDFTGIVFDTTKLSYLNGSMIDHIPVIAELRIN